MAARIAFALKAILTAAKLYGSLMKSSANRESC
jgi:hypothetical protein